MGKPSFPFGFEVDRADLTLLASTYASFVRSARLRDFSSVFVLTNLRAKLTIAVVLLLESRALFGTFRRRSCWESRIYPSNPGQS